MKILWVCNIVLPLFCHEYGIKANNLGGWMSGMLKELESYKDLDVALCFPIRDESRRKNGIVGEHRYYSLDASNDSGNYDGRGSGIFEEIVEDYRPEIIHLWGTEFNHSRMVMEVCKKLGIENKAIIDIQGLVSVYAKHFTTGIDESSIYRKNKFDKCIYDEKQNFIDRGKNEIFDIENVSWVSGRTDWDEICAKQINPKVHYFKCHRILREEFYKQNDYWDISKIERYTIFVSQGTYSIKGLHFLIRALPLVKTFYPDVKVRVAGVSPLADIGGDMMPYGIYIKEQIEQFEVGDNIEFIGHIDANEMINCYLNSHVSVSPSNVENPSNSICEAMYIGTPIIASFVGGCSEVIQNGIDGILYPNDAEYMLAGYICKVFGDDDYATRLSKNEMESARNRHNPQKLGQTMYNNYLTMYSEISK